MCSCTNHHFSLIRLGYMTLLDICFLCKSKLKAKLNNGYVCNSSVQENDDFSEPNALTRLQSMAIERRDALRYQNKQLQRQKKCITTKRSLKELAVNPKTNNAARSSFP